MAWTGSDRHHRRSNRRDSIWLLVPGSVTSYSATHIDVVRRSRGWKTGCYGVWQGRDGNHLGLLNRRLLDVEITCPSSYGCGAGARAFHSWLDEISRNVDVVIIIVDIIVVATRV